MSNSSSEHVNAPWVVVTGAGRGIGRAVAVSFARRGYSLAILGPHEEGLHTTTQAIHAVRPGTNILSQVCDITLSSDIRLFVDKLLAHCEAPLVVIHNAGVVHRSEVEHTTDEAWDHTFAVNLRGPFLLTRALLPAMKGKRRGRIVHVASISAVLGTAGLSAYCASKWGLVGLMKSLAEELRGTGLQTLAVLPGSVDTDMLKGSPFPAQMTVEDVANTLVYAALDAPDAMNGSAIEVFGP